MGPNKGPQGNKSAEGNGEEENVGDQKRFEAHDEHQDLVGGEPTQDPTTLKAHEEDHTPNFTRGPRGYKIGWNFNKGRGDGGVGV